MTSFSPGSMWISEAPLLRRLEHQRVDPADDRRLVVGVEHVDELLGLELLGPPRRPSCALLELGAAAQPRVRLVDVVDDLARPTRRPARPARRAARRPRRSRRPRCGSATATITRPAASRPSGSTRRWRAKLIGSLSISSAGMSSARGRSRRYGISDCSASASASWSSSISLRRTSTSPSSPPSSRCLPSARSIESGVTPQRRDQDLAEPLGRRRGPPAAASPTAPRRRVWPSACSTLRGRPFTSGRLRRLSSLRAQASASSGDVDARRRVLDRRPRSRSAGCPCARSSSASFSTDWIARLISSSRPRLRR